MTAVVVYIVQIESPIGGGGFHDDVTYRSRGRFAAAGWQDTAGLRVSDQTLTKPLQNDRVCGRHFI